MTRTTLPLALAVCACLSAPAQAALIGGYVGTLALVPVPFTVADADAGAANPSATYTVPGYGPLTIGYGAYFAGQSYLYDPVTQPVPLRTSAAAAGPLALATDPHLGTLVQYDATDTPVLAGSIDGTFGAVGPVAILLSVPVEAVELSLQGFPDFGSTLFQAFAADGSSLGTLSYTLNGGATFDLSATNGRIAGLSVTAMTNGSPNLAQVVSLGIFAPPGPEPVPAPGPAVLVAAGLALAWARRRRPS